MSDTSARIKVMGFGAGKTMPKTAIGARLYPSYRNPGCACSSLPFLARAFAIMLFKLQANKPKLQTTFFVVQNLVQTFKQYINDPKAFQTAWKKDDSGEGSIEWVLAFSLSQTLSRILFHGGGASVRRVKRLTQQDSVDIKALRHSFMDKVLTQNLAPDNSSKVFKWIAENFNVFSFDIKQSEEISFEQNGTRFTFLFSIFSEFIFNALKYSDGKSPIHISWQAEHADYRLSCENSFDSVLRDREKETQKGLMFIEKLITLLDSSTFERSEENGLFNVTLKLAGNNF